MTLREFRARENMWELSKGGPCDGFPVMFYVNEADACGVPIPPGLPRPNRRKQ